jgi:hypothetical protein
MVFAGIAAIGLDTGEVSTRQHFDTTILPKGFRRLLPAPELAHIEPKEEGAGGAPIAVA